jgi:hypothetical protein
LKVRGTSDALCIFVVNAFESAEYLSGCGATFLFLTHTSCHFDPSVPTANERHLRRACSYFLDQASIAERKKAISAKHHVVKHANAQQVAGLFQAPRYLLIFRAWRWVAARVIVHEHNGSRTKVQGCPPDFTRINKRRGKASGRYDFEAVHAVFVVHGEQDEMLLVRVSSVS